MAYLPVIIVFVLYFSSIPIVNREGYLNQSQIARKARNHAGCGLFLRLHYFQKVSTAHRKSATYVTSMQHICNTYVTNYIKFIASNSCSNVL